MFFLTDRDQRELKSRKDGTFSIRFAADRNPNLVGKLPGYAGFHWEWFDVASGDVIDAGDFVLERGGTILVRIVDDAGRALTDGWSVEVSRSLDLPDGRDDDSGVLVRHADADGVFRAEEVPPGLVELRASSRGGASVSGPSVELHAGDVVEANIRYDGPDQSKRITVLLDVRRSWWVDPAPEVRLSAPGVESVAVRAIDGRIATFDDLDAGSYLVEIDDPRLTPWQATAVTPGTSLRAVVEGNASLVLRVVDAVTGTKLHDYGAMARFRIPNVRVSDRDLFAEGEAPPADGVIDRIVPSSFQIIVTVAGFAPSEVDIEHLAPHERREVVVRLGRGSGIDGILVHADGHPAARADVYLYAEGEREGHARTDGDGRFEFRGLAPGEFRVRGVLSPLMARVAKVVVGTGEPEEVRLVLPAEAFASGRVIGPPDADFEGVSIVMQEVADKVEATMGVSIPLARDGSFRSSSLHAGDYSVLLLSNGTIDPALVQWSSERDAFEVDSRLSLGTLHLSAGPNDGLVLDGRRKWPGSLVVHVQGPPESLRNASILVRGTSGGDATVDLGDSREVKVSPLVAGEYAVLVRGPNWSWIVAAPSLVAVPIGGSARVDLDIALAPGELRLTDRDRGEPLRDRTILLVPEVAKPLLPHVPVLRLVTDHEGVLRATLASGNYHVSDGTEGPLTPGWTTVPVRWTLEGPVPAALTIPASVGIEDDH